MKSSKPSRLTSPAFPKAPPKTRFAWSPDADQQGTTFGETPGVAPVTGSKGWPKVSEPSAASPSKNATAGHFAREKSFFIIRIPLRLFSDRKVIGLFTAEASYCSETFG